MELEKKLGNKGKTISISEDMSATILDEKLNKLLKRIELELYIDHIKTGTPSRKDVQKIVASIYGVSEDRVIVKNILSQYGRGSSKAYVHVYEDITLARLVEPKYIFKRLGLEQ